MFISYSHDSASHRDRVLALADRLRIHGVDAVIDQYELAPAEGWVRWMDRNVQQADFLVLVCTPTYVRRFEGREDPGVGHGVTWEGGLITNLVCERARDGRCVIPVTFEDAPCPPPVSLRSYTHHTLDRDYESLYRQIIGRPATPAASLGAAWDPDREAMPAVAPRARRSDGAPAPGLGGAPFLAGPPITDDRHFFGRIAELAAVDGALANGAPVQVWGEPRMGKTSLLNALLRRRRWDRPVAFVSAQGVDGGNPDRFVDAVASAVGRRAEGLDGTPAGVVRALKALLPLAILVDEADHLAAAGHGFTADVLDPLRDWGQRRELQWVSASRVDLEASFRSGGLASRFLNDSVKVEVGGLDPDALAALLRPLGDDAWGVAELAGSWAMGAQWLGDATLRGVRGAPDAFADVMAPRFGAWWEGRTVPEQAVLRDVAAGRPLAGREALRVARRLERRGLLVEKEGWQPNGQVWGDHVRER